MKIRSEIGGLMGCPRERQHGIVAYERISHSSNLKTMI